MNLHLFCKILTRYIDKVEIIHQDEAESLAPLGRFMLDDVARCRQENMELVVLIDYIRAQEPLVLNADDYEAFVPGLEAMDVAEHVAAVRTLYVSSLRDLIAGLRKLDDALADARLPPRPSWQTASEYLDPLRGQVEERGYWRRI